MLGILLGIFAATAVFRLRQAGRAAVDMQEGMVFEKNIWQGDSDLCFEPAIDTQESDRSDG